MFKKPQIMGILNVTPDSFSDGGSYVTLRSATKKALAMVEDGADIIDIGGESTRPGAAAVSVEEEIARVVPAIAEIRKYCTVTISIDTSKPSVMKAAADAGANIINDVRALRESGAVEMAATLNLPVSLMHIQGEPRTMQHNPHYNNIVDDLLDFFKERISSLGAAGIAQQKIWIDPGFGFGKTLEHNIELLRGLGKFKDLGVPLLVGISRKSMVGSLLGGEEPAPVEERLFGSVGAAVVAVERGADIVRVHDVKETKEALQGAGLL